MVKNQVKGGRIIFVSSFLGYLAFAGYAGYCGGKFAIRGESRTVTILTPGIAEFISTKSLLGRKRPSGYSPLRSPPLQKDARPLYPPLHPGGNHVSGL